MATIFHLALASDWAAAQRAGSYTTSTRGRTLAEEGFIHASRGDQWPGVRDRFYGDVTEPLVLLQIDTDLLGVPLIEEPAVPGGTETFPHIYGPLQVGAVVRAIPLDRPYLDQSAPAARPVAPASASVRPDGSFTQTFFHEMFLNAGVLLVVIMCGCIGIVIGIVSSSPDSALPAGTGLAGLAVGGAIAVWVQRRRRRQRAQAVAQHAPAGVAP